MGKLKHLIEKMVAELNDIEQPYEILSDPDYYNSKYGEFRRTRGHDSSSEAADYFHIINKDTGKDLLKVYFHKDYVEMALLKKYEEFSPSIECEKFTRKNRYKAIKIAYRSEDKLYDDTLITVLEFIIFTLAQ